MALSVEHVRCEYRQNPIGLDELKPRISWRIHSSSRNVIQGAYHIQVSRETSSFANLVWDTGRVDSDQSVHVEYQGEALQSQVRYYYRVKIWDQHDTTSEWSEPAYWEMGLLSAEEWLAEWITPDALALDPQSALVYLLRKSFVLTGPVRRARLYATSLGVYEVAINNERVGSELLTPGWTSYQHRLQYQTYDITAMLQQGGNAVGLSLANGWYKGNLGWNGRHNIYGDQRAGLLQIQITYEDGREQTIATDHSWKCATGPILMAELYHGEIYDARLEQVGWSTYNYDSTEWHGVEVLQQSKEILVAQENQATRVIEDIKPIALLTTPAGETVLDMGQNMVGWIQFHVEADSGTRIILKHAEVLDQEGNFYTANLRSAIQQVEYICKDGVQSYHPHFTFQGFRYVKVEGYPEPLDLNQFVGQVIHTDMEPTGSFECSHPLINKLHQNIIWGQKGNFLDIPSDCPQRDERMGWTGDAQAFIRTAAYHYNVAPFFTKWLRDLQADQLANGGVPFVVPHVLSEQEYSSAAWGDAAVICPWTIYLCYGDTRILEQQYDSMKAWVSYIRGQGGNEYLWNTGFHFGDWLGLDSMGNSNFGATPKDLIATAFFAYSTSLLKKTAEVLGRKEEAEEYTGLLSAITESFNKEFITPNGRLASPTQTAHVLALMFDLVDGVTRKRLIQMLVDLVVENNYHLSTGFVGTPYLCHVLTANGYHDVAVRLLLQEDYPSWLYPITKGATTIWEHWDSIKPNGSFWSAEMNSFNHYAYGAIGDWLYQVVAGLNVDESKPGYKHMILKPNVDSGMDYASAVYHSMYGEIRVSWFRKDGELRMNLTIPPNTTAAVELPFNSLDQLREAGRPLDQSEGILDSEEASGKVNLHLGSGEYTFTY
jgi:alpha-L-rhamnosidase